VAIAEVCQPVTNVGFVSSQGVVVEFPASKTRLVWSGRLPCMKLQVNVQEAKTRLSQLLAQAEHGDDVVIARDGVPVVRLLPVAPPVPRPLGFVAGSVPDAFFEPLPDDELAAWG